MESFEGISSHHALDQSKNEIRIVRLLPSQIFGSPVECELDHVLLEKADYEALSYFWGDPKITQTILVDRRPYPLTINLVCALRYLRYDALPRTLWIDSLCINQTDIEEREREVKRMRHIYAQARDVLIWIGDYNPYSRYEVKKLFDKAKTFSDFRSIEEQCALTRKVGYDEIWSFINELRCFLYNRPWFSRMWVLQEVASRAKPWPKNVGKTPEIMCGHLKLPFSVLMWIDEYWVISTAGRLQMPSLSPTLTSVVGIWEGHQRLFEIPEIPLGRQLAWFLSRVAGFQASDPRDLIYALQGLLTADLPSHLLPNYTKDVRDIFLDCASFIIEDAGILDIIQCNSMATKGLPSWVPDWRRSPWPYPHRKQLEEGKSYAKVFPNQGALEADMIAFTCVERVGTSLKQVHDGQDWFDYWLEFTENIQRQLSRKGEPPPGYESLEEALWLLAIIGDNNERRRVDLESYPIDLIKSRPSWQHGIPRSYSNVNNVIDFERFQIEERLRHMSHSLQNRCFFRCDDGSVGLMAQPDVSPMVNDRVCSVKGLYSEAVLRGVKGGYKVVGQGLRTSFCRRDLQVQEYFNICTKAPIWIWEFHKLWKSQKGSRVLIF
ncbi:HET-domain-containing protein [Xylariaceae sp. FL1272]|nr:HET-domain-containing protein [Xylariaceae sp. FL1272]